MLHKLWRRVARLINPLTPVFDRATPAPTPEYDAEWWVVNTHTGWAGVLRLFPCVTFPDEDYRIVWASSAQGARDVVFKGAS